MCLAIGSYFMRHFKNLQESSSAAAVSPHIFSKPDLREINRAFLRP